MTPGETSHVAAGRRPASEAAQSLAFVTGIGVGLALSLSFAVGAFEDSAACLESPPGEQINPNEAPLASLVRLPGIGLARARAIVAYRDQVGARAGPQPVFQAADDLQQIKGIGPAIVEDARPWLRFDHLSQDNHEPPTR